jgi:hypothetical protein
MTKRKCRQCKTYGQPETGVIVPLGWFCGAECVTAYAIKHQGKGVAKMEREKRKGHREARVKVKTRSEWLREVQAACNKYIRLRDHDQPCISCGRYHQGQYHAGHLLTTKAHPEVRFNELNIFKQCAPCNSHLSGNILEFRKRLIELHGEWLVDYLESYHPPRRYTIDELKEIKLHYTDMAKGLERELE